MDLIARKKLNLEILKRHDPNICDILDQSSHAVVYKFDIEKQNWEKLGYEGVIFLTQGKSAPYFGLYVLNRLSIENFSLHLTDFEEMKLVDEFLIYQTNKGEACALWFYEKKDRERILAKILKLHEGMKDLPSVQPTKPVEQKVDLLQMLKSASITSQQQPSPPKDVGNDIFRVLKGKVDQPPKDVGNDIFRVLKGRNDQYSNQYPSSTPPNSMHTNNYAPMPSDSSEPSSNMNHNENTSQRRVMANGELTKPFHPPYMHMSPSGSPSTPNRNPGALLQALHGGLAPPPPAPAPPSAFMGIPLMPQQVLGLMRPEVGRRFAGGPMLSKPEFIQQLLNMIQCDPTFFDVLYENYKGQMDLHPSHPLPPHPHPHPHPSSFQQQ